MVVKLLGGLGNQMFQYAFGRALELSTNSVVKYDVSALANHPVDAGYTLRNYELGVFNIKIDLATRSDLRQFDSLLFGKSSHLFQRMAQRYLNGVHRFIESDSSTYDEHVFQCIRNTYFEGYWQNERYFKKYENQLINEFSLKNPLSGFNLTLSEQIIKAPNAISLHIRRGDYVSNKQANQMHGVCSPKYYQQSVKILKDNIGELTLFIFSDEPDWVQKNMVFDFPTIYVNNNSGEHGAEDLRLMSLCKHNIIANSSFSWWGAWLNKNPKKIIIAPNEWYSGKQNSADGIIPLNWIRV